MILQDGSEIRLVADFLSRTEQEELTRHLQEAITWQNPRGWRRDVAYMADEGMVYEYSGIRLEPVPWSQPLRRVRDKIRSDWGVPVNSLLLNRYQSGEVGVGRHQDNEPCYAPDHIVASVSLGEARTFRLRAAGHSGAPDAELDLPPGSLVLFPGKLVHWIPRTTQEVGQRLNLTYRCWREPPQAQPSL